MRTLKLISELLDAGCDNSNIAVHYETDHNWSFASFYGVINANGKNCCGDHIKPGVIVWGEENFIGIPDTVFTNSAGDKIGYYEYIAEIEPYAGLLMNRK